MTGFINLLKPKDMSSAYAVGAVKYRTKTPCGHMGTLDPMASGVLPVGVGKASRLFPYMLDKEKEYKAEFVFGEETDTLDITGSTQKTTDVIPTVSQIESVLKNFIGDIEQIPPKYSAKCVDGKRGYALARKGVDFTLNAKKVSVLDFKLLEQTDEKTFTFLIKCKGGTYIRSLARDLGYAVGSLGTMSKLERTKSGVFTTANGVSVEEFKKADDIEKYLIPADSVVDFEKIVLAKKQAQKILDGVFDNLGYKDGTYRVYSENEFWGVGQSTDGVLRIKSYVR